MIALIPARKGSKRVKGKNFKYLNKKPLIYWTIKKAKKSKLIKKIFISSDCKKIINYSKKFGIENMGIRPKKLSVDTAKAIDVYLYEFKKILKKYNCEKNFIVLLPTSPLRKKNDIDNSIRIFKKKKLESLISCKKIDKNYENWKFKISGKDNLIKISKKNKNKLIQNAKTSEHYIPNGSIYIFNYDILRKNKNYYTKKTAAYVMDDISSLDIDTMNDFNYCEFLSKKFKILN